MPQSAIDSWKDLTLRDLFYAYRKAKADCFFDRTVTVAVEFANFEIDLVANLQKLLADLQAGAISSVLKKHIGKAKLMAKGLGLKELTRNRSQHNGANGHGFFSDPVRALDWLAKTKRLEPEFRMVGEFPVEMHVLSALWINLIGHKYDVVLSRSAYGSRLRRIRPAKPGTHGRYHLQAIGGSYERYINPYRRWRANGLAAIRRVLEANQNVIALSLDFASYYHRVDPAFISDARYLRAAGITLKPWELRFTRAFASTLSKWSALAREQMAQLGCGIQEQTTGIPIGLSITPVLANVLLFELDQQIEKDLSPVYYGRYVDDIFLVLRDPGDLNDTQRLHEFLAARCKCFPPRSAAGEVRLKLPGDYQGKTELVLQETKQKCFFLQGRGGLDLLDNIENQIRRVSSERRLMPSPRQLTRMASAKVLTADGHPADEADTLRKADSLVVRRLGWSIQLGAVETLAKDLRKDDWTTERTQFYQFAHRHILRPDKILDHMDYFPRLISLAVALEDWAQAKRLTQSALSSLSKLEARTGTSSIKINGLAVRGKGRSVWAKFEAVVKDLAQEAILRSIPWSKASKAPQPLPQAGLALCRLARLKPDQRHIHDLALRLREADWAKISYKDHLRRYAERQRPLVVGERQLIKLYPYRRSLIEFLTSNVEGFSGSHRVNPECKATKRISILPYLFPTRPYSAQEIALFLPDQCVLSTKANSTAPRAYPANIWARYVRAVRGIVVRPFQPTPRSDDLEGDRCIAILNDRVRPKAIRLGISSLLTPDEVWRHSASGQSDLSPIRYQRIERLVNQAIDASPRPTYLLLPEVSLPERWIDTVSKRLGEAGINLIAGLDYHHSPGDLVHSSLVLVLADDRLGHSTRIQIRQPKSLPAPHEGDDLLTIYGKSWDPRVESSRKPVYRHQGFCFGVLICSELQNMGYRMHYQGRVDCLMVLSWNRDLETFSSLVESASLDVHANIALVNNRQFGDSRVRLPAKRDYKRDLCRIQGGLNEHVIVVQLDIDGLRSFQSRATRSPQDDDPFKPVPEGYRLATYRKRIPK